jgi:hypothetical protein
MIYAVRKFIVPKSDPKIKIIRNFKNFNANGNQLQYTIIPMFVGKFGNLSTLRSLIDMCELGETRYPGSLQMLKN